MGAKIPPTEKKPPGALQRYFFCWMLPIFYFGYKRDLEEYDLARAKHMYDSKILGDKLERIWLEEEKAASQKGRPPSFKRVLFRAFALSFMTTGLMQLLYVAIRTTTPLLFAQLLLYWSVETTMSRETATFYALGMILANWVAVYMNHHGNLMAQQFGMKLRVATSSVMFRKIMRMDNASLGDTTAGKVVNILSNDLQRMDLAFLFIHYVWIIPIQLAAVSYLGYIQAGFAAIIGLVCLMVITLPIQGSLSRLLGKVRFQIAEKTDDRIKIMSEVINGIQVIKMYAWEEPFEKVVSQKRAEEMAIVKKSTILRSIFLGFMVFTERISLFLTIITYILLGNTLSANVIYPLQQFMAVAQINLTLILPLVLTFTAEVLVAIQRVQEFLSMNDRPDLTPLKSQNNGFESDTLFRNRPNKLAENLVVQPLSYSRKNSDVNSIGVNGNNLGFSRKPSSNQSHRRSLSHPGDFAVEVRDVSCSWLGDPNFLSLKNISLRIRRGKLCAIIGAVGSGKSSFLQLLLKELPAATGNVSIYGNISYASQEAWLFPNTVRENILFGLPYDAKKYKEVCNACTLYKDFKQFPFADQTIVGERGVSLSGGQRARINLARAVYREADIYMLDDPLSAVDANVGRMLFEGCINGYLRGRTRILVTHQIHFLKAADFIVVMNNGAIENMGTFDELVSSGKEFATILAKLQDSKEKDETDPSVKVPERKPSLLRLKSELSEHDENEFEAQKIAAEERQSGNLKWEVLAQYFKSAGLLVTFITVFLVLAAATAGGAADYFVSYWTNQMAQYEEEAGSSQIDVGLDTQVGLFTTSQYLIIHGVIVFACLFLTNLRNIPFTLMCVTASKVLHNNMFSAMLKGIMRFFDTSSSGRILNRFTKDMGNLDELLPRALLDVFQIYTMLFSILILNAIALYYTLIPSLLLLILFTIFVKIYMKTAQSVKRLEGTTKSPVFGMVTSSLTGIATIRSAGAETRLIEEFDNHQDLHTCAWNGFLGGGATFAFYIDTLCLVYFAAVVFVCLYLDLGGLIPVGSVGLVVTQTNTLTAMLQHGARMLVEFVAQLTSVERIMEYTKIETETNLFEGKISTPDEWPARGSIEFQNVNLKYALNEAPVLKNLNIHVESGWKVGIVGRTGAGKSSLISALFRFAYIEGLITIDGIDTALIGKQELRKKISIIPQEPVLFSATIRYNLDPFNLYSDEAIWRALEQVEMKSAIPSLDFKVTESGANFSVGQRQLMCLARAILRSNTILIMDEATANVDPRTDNFIQQTIRHRFAKCTVLTIAHRLNTIMDSDRVLVMDSGEVAEFDHPYTLLSNPNSHLTSMVSETGPKMKAQLFNIAKDAYLVQNNLKDTDR